MVQLNRGTFYYQSTKSDDSVIKETLTELAIDHPRWGAKKMTAVIRNQGEQVNHKKIRRIYREMQLNIRIKPKKRFPSREPVPLIVPEQPNVSWSVDFMSDALASGQRFRTFREDVLDAYLFSDLREVQEMAFDWMEMYNTTRPHEALGNLSPQQFAMQAILQS